MRYTDRNVIIDGKQSKKITAKESHRNNLIHKLASKPGLRPKIDAKCVECIYDPHSDGTWRNQVVNCTCSSCPLFEIRATLTPGAKS